MLPVEVHGPGEGLLEDVRALLDELRGCKLTYVDASSLVWLRRKRISTVWGTDHHLAIQGANVIPGPPSR
ncbi:MAG: hypothetical protein ACE5HU_03245 [Acidobacteriota bacterium]